MTTCELCDGTGELAVRGMDGDRYEMVPCDCVREADPLHGPHILTSALTCGILILLIVGLVIWLTSCGGSPSVPAGPPPATNPGIPTSWTVTDLVPLPGFNASQANAVNSSGTVVGYSEAPTGTTEATEWVNGQVVDLGPGIATAINDSEQIVGYSVDPTGMFTTAHLWQSGAESDIGTGWLPEGINSASLVVGTPVEFGPAQQWDAINGQRNIDSCQAALAVNDSGQIAGIAMNGGNATICGQADYGQLGAATTINNSGQAVGYVNPSAVEADAVLFPDTMLAQNALATGINDLGWVVGETLNSGGTNDVLGLVLSIRRHSVHSHIARLAGQSHPWIWSQASGLISLPDPLITADGISGSRVVGAGLAPDGTIHGFLLEGKP